MRMRGSNIRRCSGALATAHVSFVAAVIAAFGLVDVARADPTLPRLVIDPPGDGFRQLFEHPDQWQRARAMTDELLYADHNLARFSDSDLKEWFAMMRNWHIPLELEVGAIKGWGPTAEDTFHAEQPMWNRFIRLGADLNSIAMDEPLAASRYILHKPDAYAYTQTVRFIEMARENYPGLRIGDIEPYPGIPENDHTAWLRGLQERLRQDHVRGLDFYRVDADWVAFTKTEQGSWKGVASLAATVRNIGVPFSLIYWASGYPSEMASGVAGEDTWYIEVLGQGYAVSDVGSPPDQFVLESWIGAPKQTVPETGDFTFMRSVLDFGRKFLSQHQGVK